MSEFFKQTIEKEKIDYISLLEKAETAKEKQKILNEIFPKERRDQMIADSSEDINGRGVRYYRYIKFPKLLGILKTGKLSAHDYFNLQEAVDIKMLKDFLIRHWSYLEENNHPDIDFEKLIEEEDDLKKKSLADIFPETFPEANPQDIEMVVANPNNQNILAFIEKYASEKFLKAIHTGSSMQCFSPYLSMSVGGIINDCVRDNRCVYLEIVVPNERIILHPETDQGEKEVLIKEIKKENISRVFTDSEQLKQEVLEDISSAIGDFGSKHKLIPCRGGLVEQWRWDEKTEDCLPVGLLDNLKE